MGVFLNKAFKISNFHSFPGYALSFCYRVNSKLTLGYSEFCPGRAGKPANAFERFGMSVNWLKAVENGRTGERSTWPAHFRLGVTGTFLTRCGIENHFWVFVKSLRFKHFLVRKTCFHSLFRESPFYFRPFNHWITSVRKWTNFLKIALFKSAEGPTVFSSFNQIGHMKRIYWYYKILQDGVQH